MTISLPVQTAVFQLRTAGAPEIVVASQVFVEGVYRAPEVVLVPPQTIISLPVHTAV
jgi:hypothetical protein